MPEEKVLWKGLLAGLIGGLVATAAKTAAEKFYPPHPHGEPEPPEVLAEKLAGHSLSPTEETIASEAIHWGFGAAAGAVYGALAEYYPHTRARDGAAFGLMVMTLTHEGALPAMGLDAPKEEQEPQEQSSETATHILYGVVTEKVRAWVRGLLG